MSVLPDFRFPPLNEVVVGIQFAPAVGYSQIRAWEVWGLFREAFPKVQELPPLAPTFEMFGLPQAQMNFGFVAGASHDRFWFLNSSGEELIQFQHDRLLHNWRKVAPASGEYPRFEAIIQKFEAEARVLEAYFATLQPQQITVNQCEISYINHIRSQSGETIEPSDFLTFFNPPHGTADDFAANFRRIIREPGGRPIGRVTCEVGVGTDASGRPLMQLITSRSRCPVHPNDRRRA